MSALQLHGDGAGSTRGAVNAAYRRKRLHMMLNQEAPDLSTEPDPDRGDLQDYKFLLGDIVYLLDRKRDEAERWRVVTVFDEMVSLQLQDADRAGQTRWQKCDTDKLVLEEVYLQQARYRIRYRLREELSAPTRAAATRGRGAEPGPEGDDPDARPWQGAQGAVQGAPQEGTDDPSDRSSEVEAEGESDDADLYA